MRILFVGAGSHGDVQPLLTLACAARDAGHTVRVSGPPDFTKWAAELGLEYLPTGEHLESLLARIADALNGGPRSALRVFNERFKLLAEEQFASLEPMMRDVDLLVGGGLLLAGASLAEASGIPYCYLVYVPAILRSSHQAPAILPWHHLPKPLNRLAWRVAEFGYNRLLLEPLNRHRQRLGLAPASSVGPHIVPSDVVLAFDPVLAPVPDDLSGDALVAGAFAPVETGTIDAETERFLADGEPPIYIGFGSMSDARPEATTRVIFEAVLRAKCRAIVSRGWARLGGGAPPASVHFIGAAPHGRLFPRVAGVVHHGGAGTTTVAARAGVPQLIIPHAVDQAYWAHRVETLGLGPPSIRRASLNVARMTEGLLALRNDLRFRQRARAFVAEMRPPADLAQVVQWLEQKTRSHASGQRVEHDTFTTR